MAPTAAVKLVHSSKHHQMLSFWKQGLAYTLKGKKGTKGKVYCRV